MHAMTHPAVPDLLPPASDLPHPPTSPGPGPGPRWDSRTLLGSASEVEIQHGDQVYRLRLTALGKLILTK